MSSFFKDHDSNILKELFEEYGLWGVEKKTFQLVAKQIELRAEKTGAGEEITDTLVREVCEATCGRIEAFHDKNSVTFSWFEKDYAPRHEKIYRFLAASFEQFDVSAPSAWHYEWSAHSSTEHCEYGEYGNIPIRYLYVKVGDGARDASEAYVRHTKGHFSLLHPAVVVNGTKPGHDPWDDAGGDFRVCLCFDPHDFTNE